MNRLRRPGGAAPGVPVGRAVLSHAVPGAIWVPYQPAGVAPAPGSAATPVLLAPPAGWELSQVTNLDLVFLIDDSGSMYGPGGDPHGVRRAAALSVVRLIAGARLRRRVRGARVAVIHWGTTAPAELVLPLTDTRHRRKIESALALPPSLGATNFAGALAQAHDVLRASGTERIPLVVAITDGIEALGADTAEQAGVLPPHSLHVLLVDYSHGCTAELEAGWSTLPLGSFTRLDVFDTTAVAWQAAEVIADAVGLEMTPLTPKATDRR